MSLAPLRLSDCIPFGAHKGQQVEDLIYDEPSYLQWMFDEDIREFDPEVLKLMAEEKII